MCKTGEIRDRDTSLLKAASVLAFLYNLRIYSSTFWQIEICYARHCRKCSNADPTLSANWTHIGDMSVYTFGCRINLPGQMERCLNQWDLFHICIWKGAHIDIWKGVGPSTNKLCEEFNSLSVTRFPLHNQTKQSSLIQSPLEKPNMVIQRENKRQQ